MAKRHINPRITVDILPMETDAIVEGDSDEDLPELDDSRLRRNLLDDFLPSKRSLEPPPNDHMKVYLRIRPFSEDEVKSGPTHSCLTVDNERTVSTVPPKDSHYYKATTRGLCKTTMKYTFSRIFGERTMQKEFFKDVMLNLVKDFIDGQNCLVFSYGVTSSGKTYTIQGNPKDAGILPRTLDVLFNSIGGQQWDQMNLKPKMFNGVTRLSMDQEAIEKRVKQKVLKLCCEDDMDVMSLLGDDASDISVATNTTVNSTINSTVNTTTCSESSNVSMMNGKDSLGSTEKLFEDLDDRIREEAMVNVEDQGAIRFSVWVSFAEIYNEQIFDLLAPMPKKKNERRAVLKLSEDKNGCPYIKGLKEFNVSSADEAFKLLTIGQRNLKTACTKLNHSSSRGHSIFNMKIIRVHDKDNPHLARVSQLSLCDLAGSERYSKTQSDGERLKEAGNINTSLLTLGRCIETLRHNQHHKENPRIIPFRESKLTRLFQNYFSGQGKASMIVNVNQCASMFDETQHVFKFSAIASQVVVPPKPIFVKPRLPVIVALPNPIPRATSICWATPGPSTTAKQQVAENVPLPEDDEDLEEREYTQENIDELLEVIEQLQAELTNEISSKLKMESRIRNEVCDEMKLQFTEIEEAYSEQIRVREQMAEDLAERRIQILMNAERAKRDRTNVMKDADDEWVSSLLLHQEKVKVEERNTTIKTLKTDMTTFKTQVADLTKAEEKSEKGKANLQKQLDDALSENKQLNEQLVASRDSSAGLEAELSKAAKDKTNMDVLQKQVSDYEGKITQLELDLVRIQNERSESNDGGKADVVENLTQQLQQARQHIKEQEKETAELNDMLTEAGETFEQREAELQKLAVLSQEYEKTMEEQAEAIKVLERAAADGRVAMETADQSLSKREDCVTTLQSEIRSLEGEVQKYRNKSRFFEEQLVEKEQEVDLYKNKYNQDKEEHSKNQEALIHGFAAEISSLKAQIFHFKTQLYGVKSPLKSPEKHLKSPLSPLKSGFEDNSGYKDDVTKQVIGLQSEMNKNCAAISELEHALQLSREAVHDLENKLTIESDHLIKSQKRIEELETCLKNGTENEKTEHENDRNNRLSTKMEELLTANEKVKELEMVTKDYFSKSSLLTASEAKIKSLNEEIDCKNKGLTDCENRIKKLDMTVNEMKVKESEISKLEERNEELGILNCELKEMVNKATTDLQTKEKEIEILYPRRSRENFQMDSTLEFRIVEKEFENQELQKVYEETAAKIDDLKSRLNEKVEQLSKTGEELAVAMRDVSKLKRKHSEIEATLKEKDLEISELMHQLQDTIKEKEFLEIKVNKLDSDVSVENKLQQNELNNEITCLKSELRKVTAERENMQEKLKENICVKEELMKLECLLKGKDEKLAEVNEQLKLVLTEKESLVFQQAPDNHKTEIERLKLVLQEKDEELAMFSQNLDAILEEQEEGDLHKDKAAELAKQVEYLEGQLKQLSSGMQTKKAELEESVVELESAVVDKEVEICDRERHMETMNAEMEYLKSKVGELEQEAEELKKNLVESRKIEFNQNNKIDELTKENATESAFKVEELQKEIAETKVKLEEYEKNKYEECSQIKDLKSSIEEKINQISKLSEELESADNSVRNLEKELQISKDQLISHENLQCKVEHLEGKLKETVENKFSFEDKIEEKERQMEELQVCCNELKRKLEDNDDSKLADAMMELAELKSSVHTHKTLHHKVRGELQEALLEVENSRSEMRSLKQQNEKFRKIELDMEVKNQEIAGLNNDITELAVSKATVLELEEDIQKFKRREEVHVSKVNELQKIVSDLETEISIMKNEIDDRNTKLSHLESASADYERKIEEAMYSYNELKKTHEHLKTDSDLLVETNSALQRDISDQQHSLGDLKKIIREHNQEVSNLAEQMKELKKQNENCSIKLKDDLVLEHEAKVEHIKQEWESEIKTLKQMCDEMNNEKHILKEKISKLKHSQENNSIINKQLLESSEECTNLRNKLNEVEEQLELEENKTHLAEEDLVTLKHELDTCARNVENDKLNKHAENDNLRKLEELQKLYEAEKIKNEVYKNQIDSKEPDCFSPQSSVRKLRKEKIDTDYALIEAKFKIDTLESRLRGIESSEKCNENYQLNSTEQIPSHDPLLQRKLSKMASKLQEAESTNRRLIKEVTELQGSVEKLEADLHEEREKSRTVSKDLCRKSVTATIQADPRQSISSPSTSQELSKSREREHRLHEQLNKASLTVQEWATKLRDVENCLQVKTRELQDARNTIQDLEKQRFEGRGTTDKEFEEYQERVSQLQLKLVKAEGDVDTKARMIDDLQQQIQSGLNDMKGYEKDKTEKDGVIVMLKETLADQENMLQVQEDFINSKESELDVAKEEYQTLLTKYQTQLETKGSSQREHIQETKMAARIEAERDILKLQVEESERRLQKIQEEKEKINSILAENNREVKEMEQSLTESRRECEELRHQGADKHAETRLEDLRHDMEKTIHDLQSKNKTQGSQMKALEHKLSIKVEKLKSAEEGQKLRDGKLKDFREERDKLVSGLEAILKKKDVEIKQLKDMIKQLKDHEIQMAKSWQDEREKIGVGLHQLNTNYPVKTEKPDYVDEGEPLTSPAKQRHPSASPEPAHKSPTRHNSHSRPPRPAEPPKVAPAEPANVDFEPTEIQTWKASPGSRRSSRAQTEVKRTSTQSRRGSRRGQKRSSSVHRDDDLPPLPKRLSIDSSIVSESDDISSHLNVDATPAVAAKTLRRTRKKYGSTVDVSMNDDTAPAPAPATKRATRTASKRSAKSRLLESFRESPIGKGSKRILENIAETFSPNRSPTKSPTKEETSMGVARKGSQRSRPISKENISSPMALETEPKPAGRGRGRHKLYKEDTYISEPFENTTEFVKSPDNIHTTVTRSLRSRRH